MESKPIENWEQKTAMFMKDRLIIDGHQVMMSWETPYMYKMVEMLHSHTSGDILEFGFGMGISASEIQRKGVKSHTIVEPHAEVYQKALEWKKHHPHSDIKLIHGFWQDIVEQLPQFDGIFFDTFSISNEDTDKKRFHFFKVASEKLLKADGALTFYYMNQRLELPYQDRLFNYFSKLKIERVDICPPPDCEYAEIENYTLSILAIK